ncbi:uncharacterized protein LOC135213560 [Macrobrachium nipponense]|uniref:uncharacterized protein LOC135213560 n=1 Tax=Macrobrachium nipponense TaxID=159736 RepID=UPI0030C89154
MRFLVTSCLFGLALAGPFPGFRYAYTIPQANQQVWSQFNERSGTNYAYGYEFPGRVHHESRDVGGNVRGVVGFVDANGSPNVWKYSSDPNNGFRVDTEVGESSPEVRSRDQTPEEDSTAIFYTAKDGSGREQFSVNPLLKSAVLSQHIYAAGSSPFSKTPQFFVDHEQVEEAGSVSALAERFGAVPVAAVHDVQSRPSQASLASESFSPLLNFNEGLYTLEVPVQ